MFWDRHDQEHMKERLEKKAGSMLNSSILKLYRNSLEGQQGKSRQISRNTARLLEREGYRLLSILPSSSGTQRTLTIKFSDLDDEMIKDLVREAGCGYALQTDIGALANMEGFGELRQILPEVDTLYGEITNTSNISLVLHPHLLVMGMSREYRPITTMAFQNAEKRNEEKYVRLAFEQQKGKPQPDFVAKKIRDMNLYASDFIKAAADYMQTEVRPAMDEFNRVSKLYVAEWG